MSKGRKPTPNALKSLRGTDQPVRLKDEIEAPKLVSVSAPPELKSLRAKKIYLAKARQLIGLNLLSELDLDQLLIYANSYDLLLESIAEMKKGKFSEVHDDNGNLIRFVENPYFKVYRDMAAIVNKLGGEFGFSPVSRQKLSIPKQDDGPSEEDLLFK